VTFQALHASGYYFREADPNVLISANGTKPRTAIEREIEIYRETLQVAKSFTPDDLEDMSILKKLQYGHLAYVIDLG
jgi:hypothetical protein